MLLVLATAGNVGVDLDEARDGDALVLLLAGARLVAILLQVEDDADVSELLVDAIHTLRSIIETFIKAKLRLVSIDLDGRDRNGSESFVIYHSGERHTKALKI